MLRMVHLLNKYAYGHYTAQLTWRQNMTDEGLRAFKDEQWLKALDLLKHWDVNIAEGCALLGNMDTEEYARFCNDFTVKLNDELMRRLTLLVLIDERLVSILNEPQRRYRWMRAPNDVVDGKSAIEVMVTSGLAGIEHVHDYLKALVYR